jgi:hypothetical protein
MSNLLRGMVYRLAGTEAPPDLTEEDEDDQDAEGMLPGSGSGRSRAHRRISSPGFAGTFSTTLLSRRPVSCPSPEAAASEGTFPGTPSFVLRC